MYTCHCRACWLSSRGAPYSAILIVLRQVVSVPGAPVRYKAATDDGSDHANVAFCGICGTSLFAINEARPEAPVIKAPTRRSDGACNTSRNTRQRKNRSKVIGAGVPAGAIQDEALVPRRGLEPPRLSTQRPQRCASTNSAIWADVFAPGLAIAPSSFGEGNSFLRMVPRRGLEPPQCCHR